VKLDGAVAGLDAIVGTNRDVFGHVPKIGIRGPKVERRISG
jgi:hypothetical protein